MNTNHKTSNIRKHFITIHRLSERSFLLYWREHLMLLAAIAISVAILIGSSILGHSVQESLRERALARLGGVEEVITSEIPFRQAMGDTISMLPSDTLVTPALQLRTTLTTDILNQTQREDPNNIDIQKNTYSASTPLIGCREDFFRFFPTTPSKTSSQSIEKWHGAVIAINDVLQSRLSVQYGDSLMIRLPSSSDIPTDSALGRKTELIRTVRVTVVPLPNETAQDFSLSPDQRKQPLAFVPLEWITDQMNINGYANTLLAGHSQTDLSNVNKSSNSSEDRNGMSKSILSSIRPTLDDVGLSISESQPGVWNLTSKQMFISPLQQKILTLPSFPKERQEVLLWLANTISIAPKDSKTSVDLNSSSASQNTKTNNPGDMDGNSQTMDSPKSDSENPNTIRDIPYSTVVASSFCEPFAQHFIDVTGHPIPKLKSGEIVLNRWSSDQLNIKPGDFITLEYFIPDVTLIPSTKKNKNSEKSTPSEDFPTQTMRFQVVAIAEMTPYTTSSDWTPMVRGLTDAETMAHWDAPFPFDATRIRPDDEMYWKAYGTAPKAFISDEDGQKIWKSRFGTMTSVRFVDVKKNGKKLSIQEFNSILSHEISDFLNTEIFPPQRVREDALTAASGNTPFGVLFMMCSCFLLISAMLLIAQLTQLSIERRAKELGVLFAIGWTRSRVIRLFLWENIWITMAGALLGILLGILYAYLLVYGLQHWWTDAIGESFVYLSISVIPILTGVFLGVIISMLVIFLVIRRYAKQPINHLLAGSLATISNQSRELMVKSTRHEKIVMVLCIFAAVCIYCVTSFLDLMLRAGSFFTAGVLVLLTGILWIHQKTRFIFLNKNTLTNTISLKSFIWSNTLRNPHRCLTIVALISASVFIVTAMSAFELHPIGPILDNGIFGSKLYRNTWIAETDQPIPYSLGRDQDLIAAGLTEKEVSQLVDFHIYPLRSHGSNDASCKNLYHVQNPMILGVSPTWITHCSETKNEGDAYQQLFQPMTQDADGVWRIPMVVDKNTAMYALNLWNGVGSCFEMRDEHGRLLRFELVGMTTNSHFPGALWISDEHLITLWPETQGWNRWVIDAHFPQSLGPSDPDKETLQKLLLEYSEKMRILKDVFGDFGWTTRTLVDVQREQMSIQNTYLAIFQLLGIFGILLGLPATLVVQLRTIRERHSELAILRAIGFSNQCIQWMLFMENCVVLFLGAGLGIVAALITTVPLNALGSTIPLLKPLGLFITMILLGGACAWFASRQVFKMSIVTALRAP